ncbi:MAG: ABC transporter permease, partial [Candidatus Natronoplasma sp.]
MKGRTFLFELRSRWKGLTIFLIIVILIMAGYVQIFPSVSEPFEEDLEGAENIEIEVDEETENISLNWEHWDDMKADPDHNYTIIVNFIPNMVQPIYRSENITEPRFVFHPSMLLEEDENSEVLMKLEDEEEPELYFAVVGVKEDLSREFIGMRSNVERTNVFEEMMGTDWTDIGDFIAMLYNMWFILLVGLYLAYISVNTVTKDFEERRMDIIFSTPISRRQYLLEKFSSLGFYTFLLLSLTALAMIGSVYSLGELGQLSTSVLFLSLILSWPLFLVLIAVSLLVSVYFKSSRTAVGMAFFFIFVQYAFHLVADMAETLEVVKPYTLIT